MRIILIPLLLISSIAFAYQSDPNQDARALQSFIRNISASCVSQRAQTCIDAGWKFAVASPQRGLTLPELISLRQRLGGWFSEYQDVLQPQERGSVLVGLLLADGIGMDRLHKAFDTDRNGRVTQRELLADVTLDNRPLGEVLGDARAVDRKSLAQRLGMPPGMIEGLFPEPVAPKPAR